MRVLAGDVGGTKVNLALVELGTDGSRLLDERSYPSRDYAGLAPIVGDFVHRLELDCDSDCPRACFGVAGPVRDDRSQTTNLPWVIDARELERDLGFERVALLNDLEATGWSIDGLRPEQLETLQTGDPEPHGNRAIIAAGTGLGEAGACWDGQRHRPFATEGGHSDYAPRTDLEAELLAHLSRRFRRTSWERVVSGPGLVNVYEFLLAQRYATEPEWLEQAHESGDPAAAISRAAVEQHDALAREALDLFVSAYGAEAGNLALKLMARGGVYIAGGIAPKLLAELRHPRFLAAFCNKGRMESLLRSMPVRVVLEPRAPLHGCARYAAIAGRR